MHDINSQIHQTLYILSVSCCILLILFIPFSYLLDLHPFGITVILSPGSPEGNREGIDLGGKTGRGGLGETGGAGRSEGKGNCGWDVLKFILKKK